MSLIIFRRFYNNFNGSLGGSRLLNIFNALKSEKCNFSSGRRMKINSRDLNNSNKKLSPRNIKARNDKTNNGKQESKETGNATPREPPNFSLIAKLFIAYGCLELFMEFKRISGLKIVSFREFEKEYLLHGEVQSVTNIGFINSRLTKCKGEVVLHKDEKRSYQKIGIEKSPEGYTIMSSIRNFEKEHNINSNEAVKFYVKIPESFLIMGIMLLIMSRKNLIFSNKASTHQDSREFMEKMIKAMNARQATLEKKLKTELEAPRKKKDAQISPLDMISSMLIDTSMDAFNEKTDIKFKDVAGLHSAKQEVKEFLDYLNNPSKFIRLGARLPRGAMLLGPPGCGKTLLIKALANESNVPFYYKAGSEFVDMIGGIGAKRMRELFTSARHNAPAIIFIDEIDAIGKKRSQSTEMGSDGDQTLNQLLVEMDGMDSIAGVVVFAATNRPDVLDNALVRPGRLDRHILIDLPVLEERKELFHLYLTKYLDKLESPVIELQNKLALQTPGMSGADIANVCNEAALTAARLDYKTIKNECFDIALERIIAGAEKKNRFLSENDRKIVAYHEAGHALVGWLLKHADPILKISIVPRTNAALGFTQLNLKERYLLTSDILVDKITVLLGGRVAESVIFNCVTSGAHDDLKKVKKVAFSMIREWGMSDKLGHLSFQISEENDAYGAFPYSKATQALIEAEANRIVSTAYQRAEKLLRANIDKLETLAQELLKKEMLVYQDIELLIGRRPHDN